MILEITLGAELVDAFAAITGDYSSIHIDQQFARKTRFRGRIVHGMLPLLLLLRHLIANGDSGDATQLGKLSCRFHGPLRVGERVRLEAERRPEGDGASWSLAARHVTDGALAMSGVVVLNRPLDGDRTTAHDGSCILVNAAEEMHHSLADLAVGKTDRLLFRAQPLAFQRLFDLVDAAPEAADQPAPFRDPNAVAVMLLSTLVGMRLPGRYATFLEFEASFSGRFNADMDAVLEGKIVDILPSGSRMRLGVTWSQAGRVMGSGVASTMIGWDPSPSLSCGDIQTGYLRLGIERRVALVTGASRGIGEASARALAMTGARVAVHYFQGRSDAEAIVADIRDHAGDAIAVQADLTDQTSVATMFRTIESELGPVDILVNNAVGDFSPKSIQDLQMADYLAELNVSLFGMHACCKLALPHMRRQRWGKIINMGTIATELPVTSQSKYITAKSAVVGYTRSLAVETAADNIQVNLVVPSMTQTSLIAGLPRHMVERLAEDTPGGRLLQPIEVAKIVLFLASDWAAPLSGQQLVLARGEPPFL